MPATNIFPVSKKVLRTLYFTHKLSMYQIAKKYKCSHSAIVYKFKKFKLKSRGNLGLTRPIKITKSGFEYLYYKRGLSLRKIVTVVHCSESGLERRFKKYNLISRTSKNRACKYKKTNFSGDLKEKAYMIGFRLGDLNVVKHVSVIQVRCSTSVLAQVKLIKDLFKEYTTPHVWKARRGTYEIDCMVNNSFKFLLSKKDKIPNWILNNRNLFFSFLAGYSDAEGCFGIHKAGSKNVPFGYFEIQTQQKNIILKIGDNLNKYSIISPYPRIAKIAGYKSPRSRINNKDVWKVCVARKKSLISLINYIRPYTRHKNKLKSIRIVEENVTKRINNPFPFLPEARKVYPSPRLEYP